jgi:hypothetical protein
MNERDWSLRAPQRYVIPGIIAVVMAAVVWAGFNFIQQGVGGAVPFLMIVVAPMLAGYYIWFFAIRSDG